jgi:DNA helicase II / ATP-dependent DNA helicase PcrA
MIKPKKFDTSKFKTKKNQELSDSLQIILNLVPTMSQEELKILSARINEFTEVTPAITASEITPDVLESLPTFSMSEEEMITKFGYLPSNYQKAILDWVLSSTGNAIVGAVAGSGKSSSLKMVAQILENLVPVSEIRVLVFGKQNALDLINKFGKHWTESISTLHSCGWNLIKNYLNLTRSAKVTSYKYKNIAENLDLIKTKKVAGILNDFKNPVCKESDFFKVLDLIRLKNLELVEDSIYQLIEEYCLEDVYNVKDCLKWIKQCLEIGESQAIAQKIFDFTDQLYLPIKWQLHKKAGFKTYKFVCVDECQDLNACQSYLVKMLAGDTGRILAVGDKFQAIMGFAGADSDSFDKLKNDLKAVEMPLSVCYRCPKSHIELVNKLFPNIRIESFEKNSQGSMFRLNVDDLDKTVKAGDIIISRKTAPLVTHCIKLIGKGIAAKVKGRDIGEGLKRELEDISKLKGFSFEEFPKFASAFYKQKVEKVKDFDNAEQLIQSIEDKRESLETIFKGNSEAQSIKDLIDYIDTLFSDETSPISLQTAHRCKGAEADRVFILECQDLPLSFKKMTDSQLQQEDNLHYVALTRSKQEMYFVLTQEQLTDAKKRVSWVPEVDLWNTEVNF